MKAAEGKTTTGTSGVPFANAVPFAVRDRTHVPPERYYDRGFFDLEKRRLWPRAWQMACRLEEIPEPYDFVEYEICGASVLVVRQRDGRVKAFRNAGGPGFTREYTHPDGLRLPECRVELWGGCAWINLDPDAGPLRGTLPPGLAGTRHRQVGWWYEVILNANWKLVQESLMEAGGPGEVYLFPNMLVLPGASDLLSCRVRPYNDDPEWCRLEVWSLTAGSVARPPSRTDLLGRFTGPRGGAPLRRPDPGAIERRQRGLRAHAVQGTGPAGHPRAHAVRGTGSAGHLHAELDRWLAA